MDQMSKNSVSWHTIDESHAGQRIDNFLLGLLKGVPKSHIYKLLRNGEVRVGSKRAKAEYKLQLGDVIRVPPIRMAEPAAKPMTPDSRLPEFPVLFEDEALLVIDKPAGVAVHGGSGVSFGVIEVLRRQRPQAHFLELAHRLDKETSGILVLAKKRSALLAVQRAFQQNQTDKRYFALVQGRWQGNRREARFPLHKVVTPEGDRRVYVREEGQAALTIFRPQQVWPDCSLVEAELKTGRTHQIRVHLAHMQHPIAGDEKYGDFEWNRELSRSGLKRMFLHAAKLTLPHPVSGEPLTLQAPLPPNLQNYLNKLKQKSDETEL